MYSCMSGSTSAYSDHQSPAVRRTILAHIHRHSQSQPGHVVHESHAHCTIYGCILVWRCQQLQQQLLRNWANPSVCHYIYSEACPMSQSFRGVWGMPPPRKISKISCCEIASIMVSEPSVYRPKKRCHTPADISGCQCLPGLALWFGLLLFHLSLILHASPSTVQSIEM